MNLLGQIDITTTECIPMEIKNLDGKSLTENEAEQPRLYLYGVDSDVFRKALKNSQEDDEYKSEKLIASCIGAWENIKNDEGLAIECNFENAFKLLKRYPIALSQADVFISKRANFLKK